MKILFISDNFPPELNAPASRTYEHAKRWVADGVAVTVITCAPNFPQGKVHPGYKNRWRSVEIVDGIRVVRVKSYISGNEGFARRIMDYISFMVSAVFFGSFESRPDVVIGTSPQFFSAVAAWVLSIIKWKPFVFELRDLWPATIVTVGAMKKGILIRLLEKLELFLYRRADAVVSVTESFREDLVARGIRREKIHVVRNGVDLERYKARAASEVMRSQMGVSDRFVVAYLGTHGMCQALGNVIQSAALLRDNEKVAFLFVGDGAQKKMLLDQAKEMGLRNVFFHDPVTKDQMPDLWSICDVALAHLQDDPVFETVIPSKIFESFGMGRPVMIVQPRGEAVNIVESAGAGEWVPPENPQALADTVRKWFGKPDYVRSMAQASLGAAKNHSRDRLAAEMLEILKRLN